MRPFREKIREILRDREITVFEFELETGINRNFFYRKRYHKPQKTTVLAIAYVLNISPLELIEGTEIEDQWY